MPSYPSDDFFCFSHSETPDDLMDMAEKIDFEVFDIYRLVSDEVLVEIIQPFLNPKYPKKRS